MVRAVFFFSLILPLLVNAQDKKISDLPVASNLSAAIIPISQGGVTKQVASTLFVASANNLSDLSSISTARTNLGLGSAATQSASSFLQVSNNLSDLANASTARTNLGLGSLATLNSINNSNWSGTALALSNIALGTNWSTALGASLGSGWTTALNAAYSSGGVSGSDKQIQFNNSGSFGASANFLFNSGNNSLQIGVPSSNSQIFIQSTTNDAYFGVGGSSALVMHVNISSNITEFYGNTSDQYFGNSSSGSGSSGRVHVTSISGTSLATSNIAGNTASDVTITSGSATTSGNFNGGNIKFILGTGIGTGHTGRFNISGLPTSSSGLSSGDIWNNSGVLTIVP